MHNTKYYTKEKLTIIEFSRTLGIKVDRCRYLISAKRMPTGSVLAAKEWITNQKSHEQAAKPAKTQPVAPAVPPPAVPPALDFPADELRHTNYKMLVAAMIESTFAEIRQAHAPGRNGWLDKRTFHYNNANYNYTQQVEFFADDGGLDKLVAMSGLTIQPAKFKEKGRRMIEAVRTGKASLD